MKRLSILLIIAMMASTVYAKNTTNGNAPAEAPAPSQADKELHDSQVNSNDENSPSLADSAKMYWNKFIDLLAGPSEHK